MSFIDSFNDGKFFAFHKIEKEMICGHFAVWFYGQWENQEKTDDNHWIGIISQESFSYWQQKFSIFIVFIVHSMALQNEWENEKAQMIFARSETKRKLMINDGVQRRKLFCSRLFCCIPRISKWKALSKEESKRNYGMNERCGRFHSVALQVEIVWL